MARQLGPSEYNSNLHSHDPPPPPHSSSPSLYNPRGTDNLSHDGRTQASNHTTTNRHHPLHQTMPITSSDMSSLLYNNTNTRSSLRTQQDFHHLHHSSNYVPTLPSLSTEADTPHQNSSALSDALADLDVALSSAMPKNTISPPPPNVVHVIDDAYSILKDQALALKYQMSENIKLRSALRIREQELQNYKIDQKHKGRQSGNGPQDDVLLRPSTPERNGLVHVSNPIAGDPFTVDGFSDDPLSSLIVNPDTQLFSEGNYRYPSNGLHGHQYVQHGSNGFFDSNNQQDVDFTQTSSPADRASKEGEFDLRLQPGRHEKLQNLQELVPWNLKPQEEIKQLKRQVVDAMSKELQLVHENQFLQRRIHELRRTIEKYQYELIGKPALQEENERLKSEIWGVNQDLRSYMSSLMSLLVEYNLQPETEDPHSIITAVKVLVHRLYEEGRRDSVPSNQLWHNSHLYSEAVQVSSPPQDHPRLQVPRSPGPFGREMVPVYGRAERPHSPTSPLAHNVRHNHANENVGRPNRNNTEHVPQNNSDMDSNLLHRGRDYEKDPLLPTLPEESSSDESDPLPAVEGLCINGEAVLGSNIKAYGISINGTKLCHFQWVRHNKDGSFLHIPGAVQPEYTITADDIDTLLSLECTPMDDKNRKGNMVQVFANNRKFITLDDNIKEQLDEYLNCEQATFEVKLGVESSQDSPFEPATLTLKRSGYELKKSNGKKVVASERYASESPVEIRVGKDCQCAITNSGGVNQLLDCGDNRTRDLLVLTMRAFIKMVVNRRRTKKVFWK